MGCTPSKHPYIEDRLNKELKLSKRDLTAAIKLSRKHSELKIYFLRCLDLIMTLPDDSKIEVSLKNISVLLKPSETSITLDKMSFVADFFALIGGAKSTVKLYTDTLKHMVTKEMFEDEIYEESNYYYEEGYDEENYLEYYEENENAEDEMEEETTEAENVEEEEETLLETERENEDDENRHSDEEDGSLENEEDAYRETETEPYEAESEAEPHEIESEAESDEVETEAEQHEIESEAESEEVETEAEPYEVETEAEPYEVETEAELYVENEHEHEESDGVQESHEENTEVEYAQQEDANGVAEEENEEETTEEGTEFFQEEDNQDDDKREDESRKKAMETIQCLRLFWIKATDVSLNFQARLATAGLFNFLAEDITKLQSSSKQEDLKVFNECLEILHNCAQNPDLRRHFQKINAVDLLMTFMESKKNSIRLTTLLTLSYLVEEEQNKQLVTEDSDFHTLLDGIEVALEESDHCYHIDEYNHSLLELLNGVLNLIQNDDTKEALMKKEIHRLMKRVLEEGTDDEMKVAISILWQLCFVDSNKRKIEKDSKLMKLLQERKGHKVKAIARGATSTLQLIKMKVKKEVKTSRAVKKNKTTSGHIMISYNWGSKEIALKIRKLLGKKQYKVWIDVEQMKGDILDSMATAVGEAAVVLMFVSYHYKKSNNCRMEATYALCENKPIIPLMVESDYKGDGWLKLMIASKLYFDFSGKKDFNDVFDNLIKELGERGKEAKTPEKSADKS